MNVRRYLLVVLSAAVAGGLSAFLVWTLLVSSSADNTNSALDPGRMGGDPTYRVKQGVEWSTIRNGPGGLAIGNASSGWEVVARSKKSWGYVVGYVKGENDFAGCAWIVAKNLDRVGPERDSGCEWMQYSRHLFGQLNCRSCGGGTKVLMTSSASEYANWVSGTGFRDELRTVPKGRCVEWRWVSKDRTAVMVKDRRYPTSKGSWVFIPRSALPATLPTGTPYSCPAGFHIKQPVGKTKQK